MMQPSWRKRRTIQPPADQNPALPPPALVPASDILHPLSIIPHTPVRRTSATAYAYINRLTWTMIWDFGF